MFERVTNLQAGTPPEFTSLCPMTGQPDLAHLVIHSVPGRWLVESKLLDSTSERAAILGSSRGLHISIG
jgi:NADPH-dependent 7-cyano-7-deazaguanine reductase QueF